MTRRSYLEWRDCNDHFTETRFYHTDDSSADDLHTAFQALSACGVQRRADGPLIVVNAVPTGTPYSTREFEAVLTFCTASGDLVQVRVPGPNLSIFRSPPNGDMVDETAIADLIAAAIGTLTNGVGDPVVRYSGGVLSERYGRGVT